MRGPSCLIIEVTTIELEWEGCLSGCRRFDLHSHPSCVRALLFAGTELAQKLGASDHIADWLIRAVLGVWNGGAKLSSRARGASHEYPSLSCMHSIPCERESNAM